MRRAETLRKKFIKDFSLPFSLTTSPHFEYFLNLYDDYLDCEKRWKASMEIIDKQFRKSESSFSMIANDVIYHLLAEIEKTNAYENLNSSTVKPEQVWLDKFLEYFPDQKLSVDHVEQFMPVLTNSQEVYSGNHDGFVFVSVDMASANFNILRFVDPEIVLGCNTYKDLIYYGLKKQLTAKKEIYEKEQKLDVDAILEDIEKSDSVLLDYLASAKYLRQVLFGKMNSKRQQTIQKFVMRSFIKLLIEKGQASNDDILSTYLSADRFTSCTSDEIIIRVSNYPSKNKDVVVLPHLIQLQHANHVMKFIRDTITTEAYFTNLKFRVEGFHLKQIKSAKLADKAFGFVKEFITEKDLGEKSHSEHRSNLGVEFKGVTNFLYAQVFKHYFGKEIVQTDLKFLHDGQYVATLDEPIF